MSALDAARTAIRAIGANRLRSVLTALGLIIGVSSVIVLVAVGQGTQKGVTDRIRGLGTDLLFVEPVTAAGTGGGLRVASQSALTLADAQAIADGGIATVVAVAPQVRQDVQAVAGARNLPAELVATTAAYAEVRGSVLASGGFIPPEVDAAGGLVAVLGAGVAAELFPGSDATGQAVRLSFAGGRITLEFVVAGVLAAQGGSGEADGQVIVPLSAITSRLRFLRGPTGATPVSQIDVRTLPGADPEEVKAQISGLLQFTRGGAEPTWAVQSQEDLIGAATEVSTTLSILLGSVAGISLLVGGIGVMNIMLVSVTERVREIGIRRAVGATGGDIVRQFVAEALMLAGVGGLIGIAAGVAGSLALSGRAIGGQEMITVIQPWSIALAFGVAVVVGFASGSYPAYRATAVDPIEALRSD